MDINGIVFICEAGRSCEGSSRIAARLASTYGAELVGLCHVAEPVVTTAECFAVGSAIESVITEIDHRVATSVERAHASFIRAVGGAAFKSEWRVSPIGEEMPNVARRARGFDLAVVQQDAGRGNLLAKLVTLQSGTPCLVIPESAPFLATPERVLVAWDGSREAARAVTDAVPFLKRAEQVQLLTVVRKSEELDNFDGDSEIVQHLRRHGVVAELRHIQDPAADDASVLLDQATVFDADLIVMGAYGRSPMIEHVFGGVTRGLLARGSFPVLLSH
jgi:nucleotide-binding universal stress UspA family protein